MNPVGYDGMYMNCANIGLDVVTTSNSRKMLGFALRPGFHYTTNATTQKQSDNKVEQSSFTLIALF